MRTLSGFTKYSLMAYGVFASLFHLYTSGYGTPEPRIMRGLHLLLLLPIVFIMYPATKRSPRHRPSFLDLLLAAIAIVACGYTIYNVELLNTRFMGFDPVTITQTILGCLLILGVVEACRRALSKWMAVTIGIVFVYIFTCQYWPGMFHFKGFPFERVIEIMYLDGDDGIFGFLTGISADILYIYILFAGVMMAAGVGDYLVNFAMWAAGWARGGSAKIAVVSSALYGTVSGSTVANVYATGSFTIPLMKKNGFTPKQSAAVEAIASTGGQIMPPIMGAGSFIMSEVTGIPYFTIIKTALIPALLYYLGVFSMVHLIARRKEIAAIEKRQRPQLKPLLRHSYYFLPFVAILCLLGFGYSPAKSAYYVIILTFGLSFLDRKTWMTPKKLVDCLFTSSVNAGLIAAALAGSGMIVATLTQTGAALAFGNILVSASHGSLLLVMVMIFMVVSVLGTGIPTTAAYIIAVTVGAGALRTFGVELLTAHLFVFYYAVLADLTPPDAVTAFAAANLSGSDMMATGVESFKLGIAGFLVPFAFVFRKSLLLQTPLTQSFIGIAFTSLGIICLAAAIIGFFNRPLAPWTRTLFLAVAVVLVFPTRGLEFAGVIVAIFLFIYVFLAPARSPSPSKTPVEKD
ncbi:MAG: C4-dicarboxylate ABC transporter permease [Deltaproteobacteria bacterium]|nr:MAG: C4-dicarboxylate ABC transporter permease [Deltaproteobacteria bacterium]